MRALAGGGDFAIERSVKKRSRAGRQGQSTRSSPPITETWLHERALRYLDRFDSSAVNLQRVLRDAVRRAVSDPAEQEAGQAVIGAVIERLQRSGVIDDARFAATAARGMRARGGSTRRIRYKLRAKGLADQDIDAALAVGAQETSELDAAREFVRRRRLGPHRAADERERYVRKDLAAVARAGFSFDVARRALEATAADGLDLDECDPDG